jgi:hypothetical protein
VAFLGPNDELGKNDGKLVKAQVDTMKGKGVQFVAEEYYERGAKDFGPALLRLIAHKPDLIETDGSPTGSIALIAKQARELGFEGYFLNSTAVLEAKAISDIAGKAGDNIIALRIWAKPPTELYSQLAERHQKKYGEAAPGTMWERTPPPAGSPTSSRRPAPSTPRRSRRPSPSPHIRSTPSGRRRGAARRRTAPSARSSSPSRRRS